jgi:hypothetical protein
MQCKRFCQVCHDMLWLILGGCFYMALTSALKGYRTAMQCTVFGAQHPLLGACSLMPYRKRVVCVVLCSLA